jgi:hypothetical protein
MIRGPPNKCDGKELRGEMGKWDKCMKVYKRTEDTFRVVFNWYSTSLNITGVSNCGRLHLILCPSSVCRDTWLIQLCEQFYVGGDTSSGIWKFMRYEGGNRRGRSVLLVWERASPYRCCGHKRDPTEALVRYRKCRRTFKSIGFIHPSQEVRTHARTYHTNHTGDSCLYA